MENVGKFIQLAEKYNIYTMITFENSPITKYYTENYKIPTNFEHPNHYYISTVG